jgi:hypothetical protein
MAIDWLLTIGRQPWGVYYGEEEVEGDLVGLLL